MLKNKRMEGAKMGHSETRRNNRGVTLIELLVSVAILTIVIGMAMGFLIQTVGLYQKHGAESNLQNEAQLTMSQIEALVVNASQGVGLAPGYTGNTGNELYIYNRKTDAAGINTYQVTHIYQEGEKLLYCYMDYLLGADGNPYLTTDKQNPVVLSDYIDSFSVDVSQLLNKNKVAFTIDFANKDRTYTTTNTVMLRNKIVSSANGDASDYFKVNLEEDLRNAVTNVELTPKEAWFWQGSNVVSPFVAAMTANGKTYTGGQVVWTIESGDAGASINRSSGMLDIGDSVTGDLTVKATALSSINASGGNTSNYVGDTATVHVKSISNVNLAASVAESSDAKYKDLTFTINGNNFQKESDMGLIQPQVLAGSSLKPQITPNTVGSSSEQLCYQVRVFRPAAYNGKTYTLKIGCTVNGKNYEAEMPIEFEASGESDTIESVRITDGSHTYEGNGIYPIAAERGDVSSLKMQVKYKNQSSYVDYTTDEWSILSSDDSISVTNSGDKYQLSYDVASYSNIVTVDVQTRYSDEHGDEYAGPTLQLKFEPVKIYIENMYGSSQTKIPVTRSKTEQLNFKITGIKDASICVLDGSSSQMNVTVSDCQASIKVDSGANSTQTIQFGVKNKNGKVVNGVAYDVTLEPGSSNIYSSTGAGLTTRCYIPFVSKLSTYDSTIDLSQEGQTAVLALPGGKQVTYKRQTKKDVNGQKHQYWATYDGKTYYYDALARQWRLNS